MYSRLIPPLMIVSLVEVGRPFMTDMPPVVSVFAPSVTLQPLLGTGALLPPPPLPPVPELPPVEAPPLPALPPAAVPAEAWPPVAVPPVAVPPLALPALPANEPPADEPPLALPPAPTAEPPLPPALDVAGVELPQPMIPIDNPKPSVASH